MSVSPLPTSPMRSRATSIRTAGRCPRSTTRRRRRGRPPRLPLLPAGTLRSSFPPLNFLIQRNLLSL